VDGRAVVLPPPTFFPVDDDNARSTIAVAPTTPPRYFTRHQAKLKYQLDPPPEEYVQFVQLAYQAEVDQPMQNLRTMDPLMFLPAPDNWRQILRLPSAIKNYWAKALLIEIKELIKKGAFAHDKPTKDDPIIPVTSKYRVKSTPDGSIEKLKARIALRGDLMRDNIIIPDTWCPIAGFRSLKIFLAMAARMKQRVYQLDYVAAFLQADVIGRKFTILPVDWKELFITNTEIHQLLGTPLLLKKSLYGGRVANLAWDDTQSEWLTSTEIGFQRLPSDGSIYGPQRSR
jgi:hypothetical protein